MCKASSIARAKASAFRSTSSPIPSLTISGALHARGAKLALAAIRAELSKAGAKKNGHDLDEAAVARAKKKKFDAFMALATSNDTPIKHWGVESIYIRCCWPRHTRKQFLYERAVLIRKTPIS